MDTRAGGFKVLCWRRVSTLAFLLTSEMRRNPVVVMPEIIV
jgi:hypothetical protein